MFPSTQAIPFGMDYLVASNTVAPGKRASTFSGAAPSTASTPREHTMASSIPTAFGGTIDLTLDLLHAITEERSDCTVKQAQVLLALISLAGDADKVVTQYEIAAYLKRPQGPISKDIDKWIADGVIEKEFVPGSQLYRQYPLTAKGRAFLTKLRQIVERAKKRG